MEKPSLQVCLSPALLDYYDISKSIVVIIDILRATSTIVAALANGAKEIIPVDSITECIDLGKQLNAITAGERNGKIAEGVQYGNSPSEYPESFIKDKTLVISTTNGTKLLHLAKQNNAEEIIIGSFLNLQAVANYLIYKQKNVLLACAAWQNKVNIEDMIFAGAVINLVKNNFIIECDSAMTAKTMYLHSQINFEEFISQTSHFKRLSGYGFKKDIDLCFKESLYDVVPVYVNEKLISDKKIGLK